MPVCKNNKNKTYTGKENTPLGRGYHASGEKVDTIMKGKDGEKYKIVKTKNGKRWQRINKDSKKSETSPRRKTVKKTSSRGLFSDYPVDVEDEAAEDYNSRGGRFKFDDLPDATKGSIIDKYVEKLNEEAITKAQKDFRLEKEKEMFNRAAHARRTQGREEELTEMRQRERELINYIETLQQELRELSKQIEQIEQIKADEEFALSLSGGAYGTSNYQI